MSGALTLDPSDTTDPANDAILQQNRGSPLMGGALGGYQPPQAAPALPVARPTPMPRPGSVQDALLAASQAKHAAFDVSNFEPADDTMYMAPAPALENKSSALKDFGREAWIGTVQMGEGLIGAVSLAARQMNADPETVAHIEQQKADVADYAEKQIDKLSPKAQAAMHSSLFGGKDKEGNDIAGPGTVGWGQYVGSSIATSVPQIVLALVPGTLIGRAALKVATTVGAGAGVAGAVGSAAGSGAAFGALSAGDFYNNLTHGIDEADETTLMKSPAYKAARDAGDDDITARQKLVGAIAPAMAAAQFGIGAVAGMGLGSIATRGAMGAAGRGMIGRAAIGGSEAGLTMAGQAGGQAAVSQKADIAAGLRDDYDPAEIARAVAAGGVGGALMGAGFGAVHSRGGKVEPAKLPEREAVPGLDPEHVAALDASAPEQSMPAEPRSDLFKTQDPPPEPTPSSPSMPQPGGAPMAPPGEGRGPVPPTVPPNPLAAEVMQPPGSMPTGPPSAEAQAAMNTPAPAPTVAPQPAPSPPVAMRPAAPEAASAQVPAPSLEPGRIAPPTAPTPPEQLFTPTSKPETAPATLPKTTQEPASDIAAQIQALRGKGGKDAVFIAAGSEMPAKGSTTGLYRATRPEGTLVTKNKAKAQEFRTAPSIDDTTMARILGYTEGKPAAIASGEPKVVQAVDAKGAVPHEQLASPEGVPAATKAVQAAAPGTEVKIITPEEGQAARAAKVAAEKPASKAVIATEAAAPPKPANAVEAAKARRAADKARMAGEGKPATKVDIKAGLKPVGEKQAPAKVLTDAEHSALEKKLDAAPEGPGRVALHREFEAASKARIIAGGGRIANATDVVNAFFGGKGEGKPAAATVARPGRANAVDTVEDAAPALKMDRSKVDALARQVTPIKKGADMTPIIHKAYDQIEKLMQLRSVENADDLRGVLRDWAKAQPDRLPGTTTRPADLADHLFRSVSGKSILDTEAIGKQARAEGRGRSVYEDEGQARRADAADERAGDNKLEDDHAAAVKTDDESGGSIGTQIHGTAEEKELSAATTDLKRKGDNLLRRVLDGSVGVKDAATQFGEKKATGAPRRWNNFEAFLDDAIAHAKDKTVEQKLLIDLVATQGKKYKTPQAKAAETERLTDELERTGDTHAQHLEDLKDELNGRRMRPARPKITDIDPEVRKRTDERLSARVYSSLVRAEADGKPLKLHDLLESIATDASIKDQAPDQAQLARVLQRRTKNLDVFTGDMLESHDIRGMADKAAAHYDPGNEITAPHIAFNLDTPQTYHESLLHEATHAAMEAHLTAEMAKPGGMRAPHVEAIETLREEMSNIVGRNPELIRGTDPRDINYALSDPHEFATMVLSNPSLQAVMKRTTISAEAGAKLARLGYQPGVGGKSIWGYFSSWVRKALGLPTVADPRRASALDHALRPVQDLVDAGGQGRADRAPSRVLSRQAGTADQVMRKMKPRDWLRLPAPAMRALLQGATTDNIVRWNKQLFDPRAFKIGGRTVEPDGKTNGLTNFRRAQEQISRATKDFHDAHNDKVADLTARLQGPDKQKLGALMNDATLAGARLGVSDPEANRHLTHYSKRKADGTRSWVARTNADEQSAKLSELQDRYAALSPASQQTYSDARAYYETAHRQERADRLDAIIRGALPDTTPAQRGEIARELRTQRGTAEFIAAGEDHPLAKSFGTEWLSRRKVLQDIARFHQLGFVRGDYFPLRRFGDYVVRHGSTEGGDYAVEMFESRAKAEARREQLVASGEEPTQVQSRRESSLREILPDHPAVDDMIARMKADPKLEGNAEGVRDLMQNVLLEYATRNERARTSLSRKGVLGAHEDAARVLAQEHLATGYRIGFLRHGIDRHNALSDMRAHADMLGKYGERGEQISASAVIREVEQRMATGDDAASTVQGLARRATQLGYVQSLMSWSHLLTNTMEAHMNSTAMLGARHGNIRASLSLAKSMAQIMPRLGARGVKLTFAALGRDLKTADWKMSTLAKDRLIAGGANKAHMEALTKGLTDAGLIDHTQDRELQRIANPTAMRATTVAGTLWQRFMNMNAAAAHAVDTANTMAIAKSAFDLEMRKTKGDVAASVLQATDMIRQVQPNYNLSNKARITTNKGALGGFAAPITQFKQYGIHMYGVMANLARASIHGADAAERKEARKAFAGVLVTHALMAGTMTWIADPLRYLGGLYDWVTGADKPHDYQTDVRGWMSDTFGPEVGELLARGLPHAMGIDVHKRVGLDNMLALPDLESFDSKGFLKVLATAMTGAAGEDAATMLGGFHKMVNNDLAGGFADTVPRVFRDAMKAYKLDDKGVVDPRGNTILARDKLSAGDIAWQAFGVQPSKVSEAREGRQAILEARMEGQAERNKLTKKWLDAEPGDRAAIMSQIRDFNAENPASRITVGQLMQQLVQRRKDAAGAKASSFGLRLPRRGADDLVQRGRFANVE